ncbi:glycosyltransferase [Candidatus Kaiserbacteria bacterium]|nr:glycosyltransferase [Candidatus Kaiserbacteria bacterium]
MRLTIIIPTYNEAGRIGTLLEEVGAILTQSPEHEWSIVVVDANSPDGTGAIVRDVSTRYKNIHLISEKEKRGIASAYVVGMRYAMEKLHADAFIEFDGDGQHDPKDLRRLAEGLVKGFDYVIGSRYVPGGSIPKEWATYRKVLSRLGSLYARILLELPVYDATSGLKATRTTLDRFLPLREDQLLSRQYAYKLQFLYAVARSGARIAEIPIAFRMRDYDISKSAAGDILESLRVTLLMRFQTLREWRFLRVVMVGATGLAFQAALFQIFGIWLRLLPPSTVVVIAGELAVFTNFFMHERFSFKDRVADSAPFLHKFIRFQTLSTGSVLLQWALVHATEVVVGHAPVYLWIAYLTGVILGTCVIYIGSYFWVWGREPRSAPLTPVDGARGG